LLMQSEPLTGVFHLIVTRSAPPVNARSLLSQIYK
jgi:hypothetical protein